MIRELASDEVRPELPAVGAAIREFVAYVREHAPGTLRSEAWQERDHPTPFTHLYVFRDADAERAIRGRRR